MKTLKILGFLLLIFSFHSALSQVDLFSDEEEDEGEIIYFDLMKKLPGKLKQSEASPIGNWAGETLELMTDGRFADAPQEYLMAFQVSKKVLKISAYELALKKASLSCEERKKLIESYLLYLGTIYLDMYSMDFFNDRKDFTHNETVNILLGAYDANSKFILDIYDRAEFSDYAYDYYWEVSLRGFDKSWCHNDISDPNVTDCNLKEEKAYIDKDDAKTITNWIGLNILHPSNISVITIKLQNLLASLPCNKP